MFHRLLTYSVLSLVALGGFFGSVHIEIPFVSAAATTYINDDGSTLTTNADGTTSATNRTDGGGLATDKSATSTSGTKWANDAVEFLNFALGVVTLAASPAILFAGWLMSPDWTSGDLFGLRTPMYSLWVTVSNIVYFVYAILLILIALGTMFGKESFSYKVMLPKLALGILMVPFTWWFVQWTISLSAVVTASVITIPMETISTDKNGWMSKPSIPTRVTINEDESGKAKTKTTKCSDAPSNCVSPTIFLRDQSGMYGYMMVYAYSVFKLDQIKDLSFDVDSVRKVGNVLNQLVMGMLMFLVFGLLTLALVAMLLVRAIKLWVYAIFSPLFTFQFVAGSAMMGGDKDTFTIKEFVGLCFVPAIVALTLSFGLILINAISSDTPPAQKTCTDITTGCDIVRLMGSDKNKISRKVTGTGTGRFTTNTMVWGAMTIDFVGKAGAGQDAAAATETANGATSVLNSAGGIFGTLIIDIIALVFIWMAFMAAKNVSKAVSMAVEPFEKIGKQVGSLASSIPKYTPIPGLGMSANSMGKVVTNAENAMIGASDKKFKESAAGKLFGGERVVATVDEKKLADAMNAVGSRYDDKANLKIMGDQIEKQTGKDIEYSSMFKNVAELVKKIDSPVHKEELLKNMGYSPDNAKKIVEQLAKKGGELDKNDTTLMGALKSRIGAPAGGAPGSSGSMVSRVGTGDTINVNIGGEKIQVEVPANDIVVKGTPDLSKLKGKKAGMKKEDFIKNLMDHMKEAAAKDLANKIATSEPDFFDK